MPKQKILIVYYTQSGQIKEIIDNFIHPFIENPETYELFYHNIEPQPAFPFPWPSSDFYDAFPEAVTETPVELNPMDPSLKQKYDLIIMGYQVWYLSPSIPVSSFLQSKDFQDIAKDTPVFSINGCRNMWYKAYDRLTHYIEKAGGEHNGHIVLFDKAQNLVSVVTIIYWMSTAKKDKYLGFFPKPGIDDDDIEMAERYGQILELAMQKDKLKEVQKEIVKEKGVIVSPHMMSMEKKAKRLFQIWAAFVQKKGGPKNPKRQFRVKLFKYYLLFMIYFVSTIAMLLFYLFYPINYSKIKRNIKHYQGIS
jgi:flavodoxin